TERHGGDGGRLETGDWFLPQMPRRGERGWICGSGGRAQSPPRRSGLSKGVFQMSWNYRSGRSPMAVPAPAPAALMETGGAVGRPATALITTGMKHTLVLPATCLSGAPAPPAPKPLPAATAP